MDAFVLLCLQTDGSPIALFNLFVSIVRDQLHIMLAMSPIGDSFRNHIRKFPAIVKCCTIDWFQVRRKYILFLKYFVLSLGIIGTLSALLLASCIMFKNYCRADENVVIICVVPTFVRCTWSVDSLMP
jgi:hypothetical protein